MSSIRAQGQFQKFITPIRQESRGWRKRTIKIPMSPNISLERRWVIFDTCAVSRISILGNASEILSAIMKRIGSFTPAVTPLVRFEYLRQANSKEEFEKFKTYLEMTYTEIDLSSKSDKFSIYQLSSELACVCKYANLQHYKHIGPVDYIHGGLLRRYPKNVYMLTFDIKDFPEPIFQHEHHASIKINRDLQIWALVKFNDEGFKELYGKFLRQSYK